MEQSFSRVYAVNMAQLQEIINQLLSGLQANDREWLRVRLQTLISVYPFSEYEYILTFLINRNVLSFQEYEELRSSYVAENRYLDLFSLSPRVFGQVWGEQHLLAIDKRFQKASRDIDPAFKGEYDLWIEGVKIEVKASRAINTKKRGPLVAKALRKNTTEPFWMNFQQIKHDICDVFVFIVVWVDEIEYWVLSNLEVKNHPLSSRQHRGGIEYQIGFRNRTIDHFSHFKVAASDLAEAILAKGK